MTSLRRLGDSTSTVFCTFIDLLANTLLTVRKLLHHMIITASLDVMVIKDLGIPAETYRVSHAHFLLILRSNKEVRWKSAVFL